MIFQQNYGTEKRNIDTQWFAGHFPYFSVNENNEV